MTQKEKELLLKDLCARLPYGVMCACGKYNGQLKLVCPKGDYCVLQNSPYAIETIKPYLRPMSSMTEEEYEQYRKFSYYGAAGYRNNDYKEMVATPSFEKRDFLNSHHFDYRGLIEKGLALEAPERMYNV